MSFFPSSAREKQAGNALFLILIAVALFAALSYVVTKSGRGGGTLGREQAVLEASRMMQYAAQLQQAITRMMLTHGCTAQTLKFHSPKFLDGVGAYGPAPAGDESCYVFYPGGGGVEWQPPPASTGKPEYLISARLQIDGVGINANSPNEASAAEIAIFSAVPKEICDAVNRQMKVSYPLTVNGNNCWTIPTFVGSQTVLGDWGDSRLGSGGNRPEFSGKTAGCYACSNTNDYYFYAVILAQ